MVYQRPKPAFKPRKCAYCYKDFIPSTHSQKICDKKHCEWCRESFDSKNKEDKFCSFICEEMYQKSKIKAQKVWFKQCKHCGVTFRKTSENSREAICESCRYSQTKKPKVYDNFKVNKPKKGISLEELNRREEYKRLMDERWACREIKGKKWG